MSLTYGGTTYRSLEEQVRKNMEDISTGAESLAALTDKVDNLKTGGEKVSLTFPAGTSSGTVTDEQLATLQANDANYIEMINDKELYYLNDPGHEDGYLTYSHVGIENSKATIKTLTITVSANSFVIVTTVVPTDAGGGKLYRHNIRYVGPTYNKFECYFYNSYDKEYNFESLLNLLNLYKFIPLSNFGVGESGKVTSNPYIPDVIYAQQNDIIARGYNNGVAYQDGGQITFSITSSSPISDTVTEV